MPQEIERKYLVRLEHWKPTAAGVLYRQGYLSSVKERVVRVRIAGEQAYLTIKGLMRGVTRLEFEYAIPVSDAAICSICLKAGGGGRGEPVGRGGTVTRETPSPLTIADERLEAPLRRFIAMQRYVRSWNTSRHGADIVSVRLQHSSRLAYRQRPRAAGLALSDVGGEAPVLVADE
jgi:CYTH domain